MSSWPWLCLLFCSPKMTETKLHKRKPGLKFTCEITCNSNGLPELVALSEVWGISWQLLDYQQSLTCKKCCKAQLKWTANINIVLDWNESLHTIVWSNISSGSLAVPHVPRAPSQSKQVRWGSEGLQLSCLFLTFPPQLCRFWCHTDWIVVQGDKHDVN